jgi:hypothetical protein
MKTTYILLCSISLFIVGCRKNNDNIQPIEFGKIDAQFGRDSYWLLNDRFRKVIHTNPYYGKDYGFYIELNNFGNNGFTDYRVFHRLDVNLADIAEGKVYRFDVVSPSTERKPKDKISYEYIETIGDKSIHKFYRPAIGKSNVSLTLERIKGSDYRTPAIEGHLEGYLYNIADAQDSVLISARFLTEALK